MGESNRPETLPTKELSSEQMSALSGHILKLPDHPDWQDHVRVVVERVMGPVHIGSLAPNKILFVSVEPDDDGLHAKLELTF